MSFIDKLLAMRYAFLKVNSAEPSKLFVGLSEYEEISSFLAANAVLPDFHSLRPVIMGMQVYRVDDLSHITIA